MNRVSEKINHSLFASRSHTGSGEYSESQKKGEYSVLTTMVRWIEATCSNAAAADKE